ncbi:MAG: hypothetical protein GY787_19910 [Alteromonadales bacterium]|nr:hypothetical protein [Alteromonadales bacterium]MCP4991195.1 hypothetical protein [Colwellia sp.]
MKAPLYNDILAICQDIANASNSDNDELRLSSCKKLQVLCATNQGSPKDHPLQWEALADFTEDGDQAMDIYEIALATADKLSLPTFTASAYLSMALRQVEFEEKDQAIIFATKANEAAKSIDSEELKTEITDLLTQLAQ